MFTEVRCSKQSESIDALEMCLKDPPTPMVKASLQTDPNQTAYIGLLEIPTFLFPSGMASGNLPEASGTQVKQQLQTSFRKAFREPSGSFRNCGETEKRQTSLPVSFRKPSGSFRNSAKLKMRYLCQCMCFCLRK